MAWYRFVDPIKSTTFVEFGISVGFVCEHLKALGIAINDVRLRSGRIAIDTSATLTAAQITHLGLEAG